MHGLDGEVEQRRTETMARGQTSQDTQVQLPWSTRAKATEGVEFYSITAQHGQNDGDITCNITAEGNVVAENISNGPFAVVNCNGDTGF